ncbi:MAG TPA: hypothetical protein VHO46_02325 [Bacteroidales bacterium]|nr:hypothetical protein [Bacteroidales bacterium]
MKKLTLLLPLVLFCFSSFAQDDEDDYKYERERSRDDEMRTLFGHDRSGGAYCVFTGGYSEIDNENAVLFGARFGWMTGHSFGAGFGATGFLNEYHYEPAIDMDVFLAGGYGGLYIEPVIMPKYPVHLSFPILFGAGGISYISRDNSDNNNLVEDSEAFLIIEPSAEIELNLTRYMRFAVGASYRAPTSFDVGLSDVPGVRASSIRGMSYSISLKFGRF